MSARIRGNFLQYYTHTHHTTRPVRVYMCKWVYIYFNMVRLDCCRKQKETRLSPGSRRRFPGALWLIVFRAKYYIVAQHTTVVYIYTRFTRTVQRGWRSRRLRRRWRWWWQQRARGWRDSHGKLIFNTPPPWPTRVPTLLKRRRISSSNFHYYNIRKTGRVGGLWGLKRKRKVLKIRKQHYYCTYNVLYMYIWPTTLPKGARYCCCATHFRQLKTKEIISNW